MSNKKRSYRYLITTATLYISVAFFTQGVSNCGLFNATSNDQTANNSAEELAAGVGSIDVDRVLSPTVNPPEGIIAAGAELTMECGTPEASIYYKVVDESGQGEDSELYLYDPQEPPAVDGSVTIEVIAKKADMADSNPVVIKYTVE